MNDMKYDVICIGTSLLDLIIRGFDPNPVSAAGYVAESESLGVGGEAVNESIAAAKLGMKAAILCSVGRDPAGDIIEKTLSENGAGTNLMLRSDKHPTPITTMFVDEEGNRRSITNSAHRYNFHPEQYVRHFDDTRAVILGSLFRAPFNDVDVIKAVAGAAHDAGIMIFADTKLPNFNKLSLDDIKEILPLIDYITPNEDEGKYYTGMDDPEDMANVLLEYGVKNVIIKLGSKGCYFRNDEKEIRLPALNVDAVDATGAGDNFIAGFAGEILNGSSIEEALAFANACGAICATGVGACTALKSREQVLELLVR